MLKEIIILTIVIEIVIIAGRLIFGSMKNIYQKNKNFFKVRIHHGYWGILFIILSFFFYKEILLIVGWSLLLSDAIHHFIVLPIWVGKTEFP